MLMGWRGSAHFPLTLCKRPALLAGIYCFPHACPQNPAASGDFTGDSPRTSCYDRLRLPIETPRSNLIRDARGDSGDERGESRVTWARGQGQIERPGHWGRGGGGGNPGAQ